jgi:hypothetical protein
VRGPIFHLIAEARGLANDHPCVRAHVWESVGGRGCPHRDTERECGNASQTVYQCARCGDYDYGEPGGPAYAECEKGCP